MRRRFQIRDAGARKTLDEWYGCSLEDPGARHQLVYVKNATARGAATVAIVRVRDTYEVARTFAVGGDWHVSIDTFLPAGHMEPKDHRLWSTHVLSNNHLLYPGDYDSSPYDSENDSLHWYVENTTSGETASLCGALHLGTYTSGEEDDIPAQTMNELRQWADRLSDAGLY